LLKQKIGRVLRLRIAMLLHEPVSALRREQARREQGNERDNGPRD
jgi:hypothetical protein